MNFVFDSDYLNEAGDISSFRWGGAADPGKWIVAISFDGPPHCHMHLQCVVDDFGSLVPIDATGLLANQVINYDGTPSRSGVGDCEVVMPWL